MGEDVHHQGGCEVFLRGVGRFVIRGFLDSTSKPAIEPKTTKPLNPQPLNPARKSMAKVFSWQAPSAPVQKCLGFYLILVRQVVFGSTKSEMAFSWAVGAKVQTVGISSGGEVLYLLYGSFIKGIPTDPE